MKHIIIYIFIFSTFSNYVDCSEINISEVRYNDSSLHVKIENQSKYDIDINISEWFIENRMKESEFIDQYGALLQPTNIHNKSILSFLKPSCVINSPIGSFLYDYGFNSLPHLIKLEKGDSLILKFQVDVKDLITFKKFDSVCVAIEFKIIDWKLLETFLDLIPKEQKPLIIYSSSIINNTVLVDSTGNALLSKSHFNTGANKIKSHYLHNPEGKIDNSTEKFYKLLLLDEILLKYKVKSNYYKAD